MRVLRGEEKEEGREEEEGRKREERRGEEEEGRKGQSEGQKGKGGGKWERGYHFYIGGVVTRQAGVGCTLAILLSPRSRCIHLTTCG